MRNSIRVMPLILMMIIGCSNNQDVYDNNLPIVKDSVSFYYDTSLNYQLPIDYGHSSFILVDNKYKWTKKFSDKYFDVNLKYVDSSYVLVYCQVSGIMNGYMLFPKKFSTLFLIDRKSGKEITCIQSKNSIESAILKENRIFLKCYNPNVIRVYDLNKNK